MEVVIRKNGEWYCVFPQYNEEEERAVIEHAHCKNPLTAINYAMEYLHNES